MTHKYKGFHKKPSMAEITATFRRDGYYKHFKCATCHKPSARFIGSKNEAGVTNCAECSDSFQSGAQKKRRLA